MAGLLERHHHFCVKVGNKPNGRWVSAESDSLPRGSFRVRRRRAPVNYVVIDKDLDDYWILRAFVPERDAKGTSLKFLVAEEHDVVWKPLPSATRLPPGAIRSEKMGKYGNMYVGRHRGKGVGMVVSMDMKTWTFYTHDGNETETDGFEVLCSEFSRLRCH